ncbi:MAG: hypothetical protein AABX39_01515, partial [Nanoarchaeota archaeon]
YGNGCFYDSLANLLIYLGDKLTANRVLENSGRLHQYFSGKNLCSGTQTKAVRTLTRGAYLGRSSMVSLNEENLEQMRKRYGCRAPEIQKIIEEEHRLGNLTFVNPEENISFTPPRIVFTDGKMIKKEDGTLERITTGGHVITQLDEDTFVDNGKIVNYDLDDFAITAILNIRRYGGM